MRLEVNAKGLNTEEIQAAIDMAKATKDTSIQDLLEKQRETFLRLVEISPEFAGEMLDVISKHYPELIKKQHLKAM